jgi:hypothetical protein
MRVSAIGWMFDTEEEVLREAKRSAEPTHNHPEGVKGAQSVALAIFLCRNGASKEQVKERIEKEFGYDLSRTLADIRPTYVFDVTCQGSVPVAIIAFLESHDFVSTIQNAISVGGDSDTIAAIAGSIAEACYGLGCVELPSDYLPAEIRDALVIAASKKPPGRIPLADKVYGSLLFSWVTEELFVKINPLAFGYTIGSYDAMPNNSASTHYRFYSDQSHLQYVYYVYRNNDGVLFFSLIVACFEDSCDSDHRDPNRVRFLEYLNDPYHCDAILDLFMKPHQESFQGYFVLDFESPPQRVSESEIPPEKWPIIHISTHQNRDFGNIDFGEFSNETDVDERSNR